MALASDAGHVVEYGSKVIADLGGLEPCSYGSSLGDGEEDAVEERQEECSARLSKFLCELLGEGLK